MLTIYTAPGQTSLIPDPGPCFFLDAGPSFPVSQDEPKW